MKYYHFTGIVLLIFTEILKYLFSNNPAWVEEFYSKGIYIVISNFINLFSYVFIFPGLFLIPVLYLVFLVFVFKYKRSIYLKSIWIINSVGFLYFAFYMVWGFNYYRLSIDNNWKYKSDSFTSKQLEIEYEETTLKLLKIRNLLADTAVKVSINKNVLKDKVQIEMMQNNLRNWLRKNGFALLSTFEIRSELPKGFFLHFSTAGMYFPFSGEGNVDPGLHPLQYTSVMAHEMAHGYGFADEGTCNFLAFICHHNDKNAWISYSANLGYWRYLASNVRRISPNFFNRKINEIPTGLKLDLQEIKDYSNRYEDWMPNWQYKIYDAYLKGQGIKEGMLNYNKVIGLVLAYKAANPFIFEDSSLPK